MQQQLQQQRKRPRAVHPTSAILDLRLNLPSRPVFAGALGARVTALAFCDDGAAADADADADAGV